MAEDQKKAPVKKGNKTTEIVIGSGAAKLQSAVNSLLGVVEVINQLPAKAQENLLLVSDLEDKIGGLKTDLANNIAQNKIELQQAYDRDTQTFVDQFLKENALVTISSEEVRNLRENVQNAAAHLETAVKAAEARATGIEKSNSANELKIQKLEHEKKEAANQAEIAQLKQQNAFLETQMKNLQTMMETQMKNETERAKYGQISTLNVGGTTQGR